MRLLHVADRLSDRGGAYTWLRGIVEALSADHAVRLVVGADDGSAGVPCEVHVRPGIEARTAVEVALDDLAAAADVVHVHNVTHPPVLEWAAARRGTLL